MVVAGATGLLALSRVAIDTYWRSKGDYSGDTDYVALGLLVASVLAIILLKVGPLGRFKYKDIELEFAEARNDVMLRITEIEEKLKSFTLSSAPAAANAKSIAAKAKKPVPALSRKGFDPEDKWKGRFGGERKSNGFELNASFSNWNSTTADIELTVTAPDTRTGTVVEFFLHPSFPRDRIKVRMENGKATLDLVAWGGFTVGVWVADGDTELELDLATMRSAPRVIKDN